MLLGVIAAMVVERGKQQKISLVRGRQVRHFFLGDLEWTDVAVTFPCDNVVDQIRCGERKDTVNMVP